MDYFFDEAMQGVRNQRISRFNTLQSNKRKAWFKNRYDKREAPGFGIGDLSGFSFRIAGAPIGAMATAMSVGMYGVQSSYDRSMNQSLVSGALDLFVSEAPTLLSFAVFSAAEKKLTGKFGGGSAGGLLKKITGAKGGVFGKAMAFAGSFGAASLTSNILQPVQDFLGDKISLERSSGYLSSVAKGSEAEIAAHIKLLAASRGIKGKEEMAKMVKNLGIPTSLEQMTNKDLLIAQQQLKSTVYDTGFWGALGSGRLIKWSEQRKNEDAQKNIRMTISEAGSDLYHAMDENNRMIIEYYSRE
jgi:hypothetical protein